MPLEKEIKQENMEIEQEQKKKFIQNKEDKISIEKTVKKTQEKKQTMVHKETKQRKTVEKQKPVEQKKAIIQEEETVSKKREELPVYLL